MEINGKRIKKDEVYYLAKKTKYFLNLLEGTIIEADEYKLREIETKKRELDQLLIKYEPSVYEEYSNIVKSKYMKMIEARKEYERVVAGKCYGSVIDAAKLEYEQLAKEYEIAKVYRDKLKEGLRNIV